MDDTMLYAIIGSDIFGILFKRNLNQQYVKIIQMFQSFKLQYFGCSIVYQPSVLNWHTP